MRTLYMYMYCVQRHRLDGRPRLGRDGRRRPSRLGRSAAVRAEDQLAHGIRGAVHPALRAAEHDGSARRDRQGGAQTVPAAPTARLVRSRCADRCARRRAARVTTRRCALTLFSIRGRRGTAGPLGLAYMSWHN